MEMNINEDKNGLIWGKWKMNERTWVLTNRWCNFCYLLLGDEEALLIDTGCGEGNIREVAESITNKPIHVINTHGHLDHIGGNFWWKECYGMEGFWEDYKESTTKEDADRFFKLLPEGYECHYIKSGHLFDLGNRKVEVIQVGSHSRSTLMLLDHGERILFTGDELEAAQVLMVLNDTVPLEKRVQKHIEVMEELMRRSDEYDIICPAHNGICISKDYVNDFRELDRKILNNAAELQESVVGFNWPAKVDENSDIAACYPASRAQYGKASIVYR